MTSLILLTTINKASTRRVGTVLGTVGKKRVDKKPVKQG
jgi:hypothetical protein